MVMNSDEATYYAAYFTYTQCKQVTSATLHMHLAQIIPAVVAELADAETRSVLIVFSVYTFST